MKKITLLLLTFLGIQISMDAQIILLKAEGGLESASATWLSDSTAHSYAVYISGQGLENQKADDLLIRNYGEYFRVDIPGLSAGDYSIKLIPVKLNTDSTLSEIDEQAINSEKITVMAHDRTGYAFWNNRIPGAYTTQGHLKENAVVLYVTNQNKNTISLEVTGATTNPCVGLQTILDGFKKGKDTRPLAIRFIGQVTDLDYMLGGDLVVENANNSNSYITLEGLGDDATIDGWGIRVKNASNIEIRNLGLMNTDSDEGDNLGLQQNNDHIWVHNCDFFYGNAGGDADQAKGDGALDVKKSTYITLSYNHFWDTGKSNLLGLSEGSSEGLFITYHHNWYDHSDSRHPRVRYYSAHVYNNYYDGIANYGVGSTLGSSVFVEANYFRNCRYPILTSMQGSDVWNESTQTNDYNNMPTFSSEDGGTIKSYQNYMIGQRRFVPYASTEFANSSKDFDAFVANTRDEQIPNTVKSSFGGNIYNNFDTNTELIYTYTPDSPQDAMLKVKLYAGRTNGGDFKWAFHNPVDDSSSSVNVALKSALTNYKTKLVSIQGENSSTGSGDTGGETGGEISDADYIQNFTLSGKSSNFFTISGNLSSSYGSVNYNGLNLTQCLKMESSTSIGFNSAQSGTIHLIFNPLYTGTIKIDGTSYTLEEGNIALNLNAGNHIIQKGSGSTYLFYMTWSTLTQLNYPETNKNYFTYNSMHKAIAIDSQFHNAEIYDSSGRRIYQFSKQLNLERLNKGVYLIRLFRKDSSIYSKILID